VAPDSIVLYGSANELNSEDKSDNENRFSPLTCQKVPDIITVNEKNSLQQCWGCWSTCKEWIPFSDPWKRIN